jgi:hypothetical protein
MRKSLLLFMIVWVSQIFATRAQIVKWAKEPTGTYTGVGQNLATDPAGNVFMTGTISGTATFGAVTLTATGKTNHFLARYDTAGVCRWAKLLDSTITVGAINTDAAGNFYIAGSISEGRRDADGVPRVSFDNINLEVADGAQSGFVAKYNQAGVCQWATLLAVIEPHGDFSWTVSYAAFLCNGLAVHASGNIAITGHYYGKVAWRNTATIRSGSEMFLVKCDAAGRIVWVRNSTTTAGPNSPEGSGGTIGKDVGMDAAGNMYVTGYIDDFDSSGTVASFDPHTLRAQNVDIFIAKYDPAGRCLWAQRAGSAAQAPEEATGIAVDPAGNSYITGYSRGAAQFGSIPVTASKLSDAMMIFLARYDADGNCTWVKKMLANVIYGKNDVALLNDDVFITGYFNGVLVLDG